MKRSRIITVSGLAAALACGCSSGNGGAGGTGGGGGGSGGNAGGSGGGAGGTGGSGGTGGAPGGFARCGDPDYTEVEALALDGHAVVADGTPGNTNGVFFGAFGWTTESPEATGVAVAAPSGEVVIRGHLEAFAVEVAAGNSTQASDTFVVGPFTNLAGRQVDVEVQVDGSGSGSAWGDSDNRGYLTVFAIDDADRGLATDGVNLELAGAIATGAAHIPDGVVSEGASLRVGLAGVPADAPVIGGEGLDYCLVVSTKPQTPDVAVTVNGGTSTVLPPGTTTAVVSLTFSEGVVGVDTTSVTASGGAVLAPAGGSSGDATYSFDLSGLSDGELYRISLGAGIDSAAPPARAVDAYDFWLSVGEVPAVGGSCADSVDLTDATFPYTEVGFRHAGVDGTALGGGALGNCAIDFEGTPAPLHNPYFFHLSSAESGTMAVSATLNPWSGAFVSLMALTGDCVSSAWTEVACEYVPSPGPATVWVPMTAGETYYFVAFADGMAYDLREPIIDVQPVLPELMGTTLPVTVEAGRGTPPYHVAFTASFNIPVFGVAAGTTVDNGASLTLVDGVDGDLSYGFELTGLADGETYLVSFTAGIVDVGGSPLQQAPVVVDVSQDLPGDLTLADDNLWPYQHAGTTAVDFQVSFNERAYGVLGGVSVDNGAVLTGEAGADGEWDYDFTLSGLADGTTYTVSFAGTIVNSQGVALTPAPQTLQVEVVQPGVSMPPADTEGILDLGALGTPTETGLTYTATRTGPTNDDDESACSDVAAEYLYQYTAAGPGSLLTFDSFGSNLDTVLNVYNDLAEPLGCNDDIPGMLNTSRVTLDVCAHTGDTFFLGLEAYHDEWLPTASKDVVLHVTETGAAAPVIVPADGASNVLPDQDLTLTSTLPFDLSAGTIALSGTGGTLETWSLDAVDPVGLTVADAARTLRLDPAVDFSVGDTITVSLTGVTDFCGGAIAPTWSFTVSTIPPVQLVAAPFDTGAPAGFVAEQGATSCAAWQHSSDDACVQDARLDWQGWPALSDGNFMIADSDCAGSCGVDATLTTPAVDASSFNAVTVMYDVALVVYPDGFNETFDVEASIDGGATWSLVQHLEGVDGDHVAHEVFSLPTAVGQADVRVRFHYVSNWDYWVALDNVRLIGH